MFIKQIIIKGFKSYKEQVVVGVLHPEHNVVVGHNGVGKSNLFSAIEFVLNGDKAFKQQKNRLSLLHEGVGPQVLSAHVEIVFDNSDGTFPIDSREVSLRRVISMKKDQFFLNKETVTKKDVNNLLGSAGLASCHPYYIVKQGKVTELAEAPESFHLELVKKVAGVQTCENRCNQTMNCFEGLSKRGEKVDRTIDSITELKETLNGMSEELREFQRLDKLKRGLHFVFSEKQLRAYERKLRHIRAQLEEADGHSALVVRLHQAKENVVAASKQLWELKEQIKGAKEKENNLQLWISELRLERTYSQKHLDELKEGRNSHKTEKESIERDLQKAREAFAEAERELAIIQPELDKLQKNEEELSKEIQSLTEERESIEMQHVRNKQYKTKEERNITIEKTLKVLQLEIQNLTETAADLAEEMRKMKETQVSLEKDALEQQDRRATLKNMENSLSDLKSDVKELKIEKIEILNKKTKEEQELSILRNKFEREERGFRSVASKVILDGINSVARILDSFREDNDGSKRLLVSDPYYGLVIDNFSCEEMVKTAVEVSAGGYLFHHIVATVQVANEILKEMNRLNLPGEVSFLPVESLFLRPFNYPITQQGALPLVSKLTFEDRFNKVFEKIFGSTFICQSLDIAVELARCSRVDCVTFDGDQVSRHGWLMGGYVDPQRSRFKLYQARKACLLQMKNVQANTKRLEDELNEADRAYNEVVTNVAKKSFGMEVFKRDSQVISARLDHQKLAALGHSLKEKKESLDHVWILLDTLTFKATKLEEELTQDLPPVRPLDMERCNALNIELMQIKGQRHAILEKLQTKRNQEEDLLNALKDNSVERFKRDFEEIDLESEDRQIEKSTSELESLSLLLLTTKEELTEQSAGLQVLLEQERAQQLEFKKLETVKHLLSEKMKQALSQPKALQVDEVEYKQKIENLQRKIEEMGPVPNGVETFATWNTRKVLAELDKVKAELRGYEHVTMRALAPVADILKIADERLLLVHQFRAFFQSVSKSTRMSEQLKDHALRIAFRTVQRHFKDVFQRFVPNGQGKLRLIETSPADSENGEFNIAGVLVKVSFTGGQPSQEMRQLSAGQKSVVALALIFAVQKCNPSPFYILDEIDHALDLQYRQTLTLIVREMKAYSQFITITFRPELLQYADKFLGLKYCNKQSYVGSLAKEEALKIVTKGQGTGR